MIRYVVAIFFIIGASQLAKAQCTEALNRARAEFDNGNVERVSAILYPCIKELSKENQVEAYRLLSISYLYMDDPMGAETSFLALLEIDPEFRVSPADPVELLYLSKQYITTPIISYALKAGANISTVTVLHSYSADGNSSTGNYRPLVGFNIQGELDLHFNKTFSLMIQAEIASWSYGKETTIFEADPQELTSNRFNLQASIPIALKYTFSGEKTFPYLYAGYSPSYTILAQTAKETRDPIRGEEVPAQTLNLKPQTNSFNNSLIFGIGLEKRIGQRFGYKYLSFDLRYRMGMSNMTNEKTVYETAAFPDNAVHLWEQLEIDDAYRWNSFEFTVGYVWPQYKPRAKNSVTLQTVLKSWFSKKDKVNE